MTCLQWSIMAHESMGHAHDSGEGNKDSETHVVEKGREFALVLLLKRQSRQGVKSPELERVVLSWGDERDQAGEPHWISSLMHPRIQLDTSKLPTHLRKNRTRGS